MELYNLEKLMIDQNPHWASSEMEDLGYSRDIFDEFCSELLKDKLIISINGPRRSGKTFLIKKGMTWLSKEKNISVGNILYFQFSASLNSENIVAKITDLFLKKYSDKPGRKYIFLDEVQYIDYWQDQIKLYYDLNLDIKFIVTGSTSLFYDHRARHRQKSKESLAGRIYKLGLGALSFHEYLKFKRIEAPTKKDAWFISNLAFLKTEFKHYLCYGQYPEIVSDKEIDPKKYISDLSDQIINFDISYLNSKVDRKVFLDVVKTFSFDLASEFSFNNIGNSLGVDRREISEYSRILQELNLFSPCYNSAYRSMRKKIAGVKKIYSLNLNLSLHINGFDESYLNDSRVFGRYLENYVFMRFLEKYQNVEYYRVRNKEIDFIANSQKFEVKTYGVAPRDNDIVTIFEEDAYLL